MLFRDGVLLLAIDKLAIKPPHIPIQWVLVNRPLTKALNKVNISIAIKFSNTGLFGFSCEDKNQKPYKYYV